MGGNASPFIADLYLSWCEYCYVTKLTKTDYNLAKRLSYNCRYLDDICTVNLIDFDTISKDIYDNTLILEGSTCSYKRDNILDLYIRFIDGEFVTGIYHKVDDFNFGVISYPFPDSNIHSSLGYSTFYSQLISFTGSVITSQISCSGLNLYVKNLLIVVTNLIFCESLLWDLPINIQWKLNMESRGMTICSFKCSVLTITLYVTSTEMMLARLCHHVLWKLKISPSSTSQTE